MLRDEIVAQLNMLSREVAEGGVDLEELHNCWRVDTGTFVLNVDIDFDVCVDCGVSLGMLSLTCDDCKRIRIEEKQAERFVGEG